MGGSKPQKREREAKQAPKKDAAEQKKLEKEKKLAAKKDAAAERAAIAAAVAHRKKGQTDVNSKDGDAAQSAAAPAPATDEARKVLSAT